VSVVARFTVSWTVLMLPADESDFPRADFRERDGERSEGWSRRHHW